MILHVLTCRWFHNPFSETPAVVATAAQTRAHADEVVAPPPKSPTEIGEFSTKKCWMNRMITDFGALRATF